MLRYIEQCAHAYLSYHYTYVLLQESHHRYSQLVRNTCRDYYCR